MNGSLSLDMNGSLTNNFYSVMNFTELEFTDLDIRIDFTSKTLKGGNFITTVDVLIYECTSSLPQAFVW